MYRMMWKVFCGNSVINSCGTDESLRNIKNRQASILAAAQWEKNLHLVI